MPKKQLDPNLIRSFIRRLIQQPFNSINFHPNLFGQHVPHIEKHVWVQAQIELIRSIGEEDYFKGLLETLENPLTNDEFAMMPQDQVSVEIKKIKQAGLISPYHHEKI